MRILPPRPILSREAKALKDKGFDVDIVCLRDSEEENVFQHYEDMNLYCIQARPEREKKVSSYFLKLFTFCVKSTALLSWLGLKKRYDVIHVTSPPDFLVFSTLIPKLLGARVILDIHDIGPELCMRKLDKPESDPTVRMLKWLEKISARFADHVITVTDLWKDKLSNRSVPAIQVHLHPECSRRPSRGAHLFQWGLDYVGRKTSREREQ